MSLKTQRDVALPKALTEEEIKDPEQARQWRKGFLSAVKDNIESIYDDLDALTSVADSAVAKSLFDANTILAANVDNVPLAVVLTEQQILGRLTGGNIKGLSVAELQALISLSSYIAKTLFDANTVLAANADDTPAAVAIAEQQVLGRLTGGNIKGLTVTELTTLLSISDGSGHVVLWPLLSSAVIQGTWAWSSNVVSSYGGYWYNTTHADGDELNWEAPLSAGTYTMKFLYMKYKDSGIVDFYIEDSEVGSIDTYSAASSYDQLYTVTGISVPVTGEKVIRLVIHGKNASSGSYYGLFQVLNFFRTA